MVFQFISLGGEITIAIRNGLKRSARKLVENKEDLTKLEKQLDDAVIEENGVKRKLTQEEKNEILEELKKVAEEAGSTKFITKGKHLDDFGKLKSVAKYEDEIRKLDYEDAKFFDDEGKVLSESFSQNEKQSVKFGKNDLEKIIKNAEGNPKKNNFIS